MKYVVTSIFIILICINVKAQLIAFPGAEGFGKFTTGGRGTAASPPRIFEVTKLTDDGSVGTLRYACTNNSPSTPNRIIVFRVGGTIRLNSPLSLNRANTTIAGQTAPGGGICIADYPVTIAANNMIIRYIKFRLGDKNQAAGLGMDDAFGDNGSGRQKIIIDHCTMSWSTDEALTVYKGDSVTLQWNMISEPLDYNYHTEGGIVQQHAYGGIQSGKHISIHHNLYAHIRGRMPRFDGIRNAAVDTADFRNNVLYNWADYTVNGGEGGAYNVVNNFYKYGINSPSSSSSGVIKRSMIVNPYKTTTIPFGKFFVDGNYVDGYPAVTARNWLGAAMNGGTLNDTTLAKSTTEINVSIPINTTDAITSYNAVLQSVGASLPVRDTLDQRIVDNVINRTGRLIDTQGGYPGYPTYTPFSTSQTAWPTLSAGATITDTDHDGMPDVWETQRGLNSNSTTDANLYQSTLGYSNIETYLNGDTIVAPGIINTCITTKKIASINSGNWLFARDTIFSASESAYYLAASDSNNIAAAILDNGNMGLFDVAYYTTNTIRVDASTNKPYLNRAIAITPQNPALITAPVTVRLYISQTELNDLIAADNTITSINDIAILKVNGSNCSADLSAGYITIIPTVTGIYGSYNNGYFLEFQTNSFSTFYFGSKASFILPLNLLSFNATLNNKKVRVNWQTTNEINTASFEVEKSTNQTNFIKVGNAVAAFNTSGNHSYQIIDETPYEGISYYRLKTYDVDGSFYYSDIKKVINNNKQSLLTVTSPVKNVLSININTNVSDAKLVITNSIGMKVMQQNVNNNRTLKMNVAALASGIYNITLYQNNQTISTQFIKID
ncbi:T9SS type A sorting domain-containing protein [Ferruginibacter yonginensis]|uniref:T9SS type A sorting domain-containing protein n=1 Tax=Ferruginibacter yonginensis TaxID=1310416 RepID=A0ABV8QNS1_9BACT